MLRALRIGLGLLYASPVAILGVASLLEARPAFLGHDDGGAFRTCDVPYCDSIFRDGPHHDTLTVDLGGRGVDLDEVWPLTLEVLESLPFRATVRVAGDYVHAELANSVLGFVNDLELILDRERGLLLVRSAARSRIEHGFSLDNFHARLISAAARLRKSRD